MGVVTKCKYLYGHGSYTSTEFTTVLTKQAFPAREAVITGDVGTTDGAENTPNLKVQSKFSFETNQ